MNWRVSVSVTANPSAGGTAENAGIRYYSCEEIIIFALPKIINRKSKIHTHTSLAHPNPHPHPLPGCSAARLARHVRDVEAVSSNLTIPTLIEKKKPHNQRLFYLRFRNQLTLSASSHKPEQGKCCYQADGNEDGPVGNGNGSYIPIRWRRFIKGRNDVIIFSFRHTTKKGRASP